MNSEAKKMPPSAKKAAPMLRVDPALYCSVLSGA
jgi:hypothetical protein